jgi:hypothetical protein
VDINLSSDDETMHPSEPEPRPIQRYKLAMMLKIREHFQLSRPLLSRSGQTYQRNVDLSLPLGSPLLRPLAGVAESDRLLLLSGPS